MELIFKRQATVANTPIVMKFDVFANVYLVKNLTDGDIYVSFGGGVASKEKGILIPENCSQIISGLSGSQVQDPARGVVTILPMTDSEKGVEVQCLEW